MRKVSPLKLSVVETLQSCSQGVSNLALRQLYSECANDFRAYESEYLSKVPLGKLGEIQQIQTNDENVIVFNGVTKKQLINLYTQYLVSSKKPGRVLYDQMFASSEGKCPYCANIGHATTLDHFLPKADYPHLSIIPANLVPSCKDCQMFKGTSSPNIHGLPQLIHPLHDIDEFFSEIWIEAKITNFKPLILSFSVNPPVTWCNQKRIRAIHTFDLLHLANRYRTAAST